MANRDAAPLSSLLLILVLTTGTTVWAKDEFKAKLLTAASNYICAAGLFAGILGTNSSLGTIGQWTVAPTNEKQQTFTFKPVGTSQWYYTIVDYNGNCWDLAGSGATTGTAGANVVSQPCYANKKTQIWAIYSLANTNFGKTLVRNSANEANCLDIKPKAYDISVAGGTLVLSKCSSSTTSQFFKMQFTTYVPSPPSPTKEGFHVILKTQPSNFKSVVDLFNDKQAINGSVTIVQWVMNNKDSQLWWFRPILGTFAQYTIQDHYGYCVDLSGPYNGTAASGTSVVSTKCVSGKPTQKWQAWGISGPAPENNAMRLMISNSVASNTCFSVADGNNGSKIIMGSCNQYLIILVKY